VQQETARAMRPSDDFFEDNGDTPSFYSFFKEAGHIPIEELLKEVQDDPVPDPVVSPSSARSHSLATTLRKASASVLNSPTEFIRSRISGRFRLDQNDDEIAAT